MSDYKPTGETHRISTIIDLSRLATEANIDFLMADLKMCLMSAIHVNDMHKAMGMEGIITPLKHMDWIDDGANDLKGIHFINENDEVQFTINEDTFNQSPE